MEIGEDSGIWPGAVVRADFAYIKIGRGTNIEDNCVVHGGTPVDIGDYNIVGHGVIIHCRKLGNYCLIGNNATLLEEAEIGDYCVIASGAVVGAGVKIPDYSLVVGIPGRVKGRVSPERLEYITRGVKIYIDLARQYREQGL